MGTSKLNKTIIIIASGGFRDLRSVNNFEEDLEDCKFSSGYQIILGEKTFGDLLIGCFLDYLDYTFDTFDFEGDGFIRNAKMIQDCRPDIIVCFGSGPIIDDMMERARGSGKVTWWYK